MPIKGFVMLLPATTNRRLRLPGLAALLLCAAAEMAWAQQNQVDLMGSPRIVRQAREPASAPRASASQAASAPSRPQFIDISKAEKPPSRESLTPPPTSAVAPVAATRAASAATAPKAAATDTTGKKGAARSNLASQIESALEAQESAARAKSGSRSRVAERPVMPVPNQATPPRATVRTEVHDEVAADEAFLKARARALGIPAGASQPGVRTAAAKAPTSAVHLASSGASKDAHKDGHWAYEGATGPEFWGKLKPEFNLCAIGRRQSPIHIRDEGTITGPAEPLMPAYSPSSGSVVNNGHTIQVDVVGDNTLTVRGSTYKLLQFHFHHPAEERVNHKGFSMVAHLVHRNDQGQLAVVAVLIDPGEANPFLDKVWTYMPLDANDRVPLPPDALQIAQLFPKDMRYFQFLGSLTTPPCTEGVLWMVLKSPVTASREQIRFFSHIFPNNARPVQPQYDRVVREAQ